MSLCKNIVFLKIEFIFSDKIILNEYNNYQWS